MRFFRNSSSIQEGKTTAYIWNVHTTTRWYKYKVQTKSGDTLLMRKTNINFNYEVDGLMNLSLSEWANQTSSKRRNGTKGMTRDVPLPIGDAKGRDTRCGPQMG